VKRKERTMRGMFVVTSEVKEGGSREEFVEWYKNVHIPDVTSTPGVPRAHFYESIEGTDPSYLCAYEIEGDDLTEVMKGVRVKTTELLSKGRIIQSFTAHMARPFAWSYSSPPSTVD
jgi:hypothetical protein